MTLATDIACIETAERALGNSLPPAWRRRLLSSNGGELSVAEDDWTVFPVLDSSDQKRHHGQQTISSEQISRPMSGGASHPRQ